ncbi:MAG TPA: TonB family protein [Bacteroidales bacterium]|nr:TonB family protein [Bacteroidales bacterium]
MKRNEKKIAEFDEIIFENRNRMYGAFDLRRRYNSTTSYSIIGGVIVFTSLTLLFSLTGVETKADIRPPVITVVQLDPLIPEQVASPASKPPPDPVKQNMNIQPVVTTDSTEILTYIPINEELNGSSGNGGIPEDTIEINYAEPIAVPKEEPRVTVEEMPVFPGGEQALLKFISKNIEYPSEASSNNIEGKVILSFVVNADGSVDRVGILRSVHPALDSEAVRVVKILPRFKPGKQNGIAVPVWFSLPVTFKLANN